MPPLQELQSHFQKAKKWRVGSRVLAAGLLAALIGITGALAVHSSARTQFAAAGVSAASNFQDAVSRAYTSLCPFLNLCTGSTSSNAHVAQTTDVKPPPVAVPSPPPPRFAQNYATSTAPPPSPPPPTVIQNITSPIRERVIEHTVTHEAHADSWFTTQLSTLENKLSTQIASVGNRIIPVSGPSAPVSIATFAASQNIGSLSNTTLTNPTITGGSISGSSISGTISTAILSAVATISDLTATTLVATNSTFTNATTSNLAVTGTAKIGSATGVLQSNSGAVSAITNGTEGQVLKIVGGVPSWALSTGGSGGASAWATTTNSLAVYTTDPTQVVLIGTAATSTIGNILEVKGAALVRGNVVAQGLATASSFVATSTANSSLPNVTHANSTTTNATTTTFAATSASTTNLTTGALTIGALSGFLKAVSGAVSTALVNLASDISGILPVGNGGTGWAALAAGAIPYGNGSAALATTTAGTGGQVLALLNGVPTWTATTTLATISGLLNLSSQVTGALGVGNGGTGSTTLTGILKGNGSSQVSSAVAGTDYEFPLTFNTPLSRTANAISISTAGDWTGTLGGFSAAQLIAADFSTTSADAWKLTRNFYSTTSADYWLTQKTSDNLAQGSINRYYTTSLFATDLAGTTTNALAEGSNNLYFTNNRVQTYLNGIDKGYFFSTTSASNFLSLNTGSAFSTTSANYWKTANDFFSTTSVNYWKSVTDLFSTTSVSAFLVLNQGNAFSTTSASNFLALNTGSAFSTSSASFFLSQNMGTGFSTTSAMYFAHSSTTIPKTYTANAFTALQTFANASTTNISATYASSTQALFGSLSVGNLTGVIRAASGLVSAGFIGLGSDVIGILPVGYGGTGTSTAPAYGKLLVGNALGGYDLLATSSLGISGGGATTWGTITGTVSNQTDLQTALNAKFDLSAWYSTTTNALAEGGNNLYFTNNRVQTYLNGIDKGYFFSTTSASNFLSLNAGSAFSTTSANYWKTANDFFSTTSSVYFLSVNQGSAFSTSSASFFLAQNTGNGFSTTSAINFVNASTTIPKTYSTNSFTALQTFTSGILATASTTIGNGAQAGGITISGGATTTGNLIVQGSGTSSIANDLATGNLASSGYLSVTGASSLTSVNISGVLISTFSATSTFASGLQTTALNLTGAATSTASNGFNLSAGCFSINGSCLTSGSGNLFAYLFPNNATTTALGFYASTTIGAGTQITGLTMSGSATTTGNHLIQGRLSVTNAGTSTFSGGLSVLNFNQTGTATSTHNSGINLASGCFSINNTCLGSGSGSGTVGSGIQGQLPFYNAGGTALTATSSIFLAQSGNVGIGTNAPSLKLEVAGGAGEFLGAFTGGIISGGNTYGALMIDATSTTQRGGAGLLGYKTLGSDFTKSGLFFANYGVNEDTQSLFIQFGGNVGIGTTSPTSKLYIKSGSSGDGLFLERSGSGANTNIQFKNELSVNGAAIQYLGASDALAFQTGGTNERVRIDSSGTVLIGTTTAYADGTIGTAPLQVNAIVGAHTGIAIVNPNGSTAGASMIGFVNGNGAVGSISTNGSATAYNTSSDRRVKENIATTTFAATRNRAYCREGGPPTKYPLSFHAY